MPAGTSESVGVPVLALRTSRYLILFELGEMRRNQRTSSGSLNARIMSTILYL